MTKTDAKAVIRARTEEYIDASIAWDNAPFTKPDGLWIRCAIRFGDSSQISFGPTRQFRNPGVIIFSIFDKVEKGDRSITEQVDILESVFRGVSVETIVFQTPSVNTIGRDKDEWQVNVACPFFFDSYDS